MSNAVTSTRYEAWLTGLAANQGTKRKRIIGAFANVIGDKTIEWGTQANLEHLPTFASDNSVGLIGSERFLDVNPYESVDALRQREPFAINISKFYGSGMGIVLGLSLAGFPGAVFVQQNGRAIELNYPLPDFVPGVEWDPTDRFVGTVLGDNPNVNHAWWTFDNDDSFCSRFAILFPGGSFPFSTYGRATFSGTDTAACTWNMPMPSSSYRVIVGTPVVTDGTTPIVGYSSLTTTGLTAQSSGAFNGHVDLWAYPDTSVNPFCWLRASDLSRLQNTIKKWRPAKATCMDVAVLVTGKYWDWPVMTFDDWKNTGGKWGGSTVVHFAGA